MDGGYRRRSPTRMSDESGSLVPARTRIPIGRSLLPLNAEDAHDKKATHVGAHGGWWGPLTAIGGSHPHRRFHPPKQEVHVGWQQTPGLASNGGRGSTA